MPPTQIPDVTEYMSVRLFYEAHGSISDLAKAVEALQKIPYLMNQLSEHTYPEAEGLRDQIMAGLGNVATVLIEASASVDLVDDTIEPKPAPDVRKALVIVESGLILNPNHPIAHL